MSTIFVFGAVWVAVIFLLLMLDWWGNPSRGRFRPQSERRSRSMGTRSERRSLRRDREDAAVRSVLRDRFGRSSLRLQWNDDQEVEAIRADEDVVTMSFTAAGIAQVNEDDVPVDPTDEVTEVESDGHDDTDYMDDGDHVDDGDYVDAGDDMADDDDAA